MFAIHCQGTVSFPIYDRAFVSQQFCAPQNAVVVKSFSSRKSSPGVCENDPEKSFTVSYLIDSCGLSSQDAVSVSEKKLCLKSHERPDAVLKFLREYGFTDAHISNIVTRWPDVLLACPNKNLSRKLEFYRSVGVPLPALRRTVSACPIIFKPSLEKCIIPFYNDIKSLVQSDERVVSLFSRVPGAFGWCWSKGFNSNISILRERGVPESSIVSLLMYQPYALIIRKEKLAAYVDRAVEMGFDITKRAFIHAIQVFLDISPSTFEHKVEVYRRCGWSESDIRVAFLRNPRCMNLSEKKITAAMDFFVNTFKCEPAVIAQCPVLLGLSLEKRIKPRCLVYEILNQNGLVKKTESRMKTLLIMSEEEFLRSYIVKYQKDLPELLDIYQGEPVPLEIECREPSA